MCVKLILAILLLVFSLTIFSCKANYTNELDIEYFNKYAEQYLQEIPMESRILKNPEMGEIKIKVYIEQVSTNKFTIQGRVETISEINKPSEFGNVCLDGECYDVFLFIKGKKTEKDISIFHDEYQKYSRWYPYISNHFPLLKYDLLNDPPKVERTY